MKWLNLGDYNGAPHGRYTHWAPSIDEDICINEFYQDGYCCVDSYSSRMREIIHRNKTIFNTLDEAKQYVLACIKIYREEQP